MLPLAYCVSLHLLIVCWLVFVLVGCGLLIAYVAVVWFGWLLLIELLRRVVDGLCVRYCVCCLLLRVCVAFASGFGVVGFSLFGLILVYCAICCFYCGLISIAVFLRRVVGSRWVLLFWCVACCWLALFGFGLLVLWWAAYNVCFGLVRTGLRSGCRLICLCSFGFWVLRLRWVIMFVV